MLENLLVGLIISFIGALFTIAYKNPDVYKRFFPLLYFVLLSSFICFTIHIETKRNLISSVAFRKLDHEIFSRMIQDLNLYSKYSYVIFLSSFVGLVFLNFLPNIIGETKGSKDK